MGNENGEHSDKQGHFMSADEYFLRNFVFCWLKGLWNDYFRYCIKIPSPRKDPQDNFEYILLDNVICRHLNTNYQLAPLLADQSCHGRSMSVPFQPSRLDLANAVGSPLYPRIMAISMGMFPIGLYTMAYR